MEQTLGDGLVVQPTAWALGNVRILKFSRINAKVSLLGESNQRGREMYQVNDKRHPTVPPAVCSQQMFILMVDQDAIHLGQVQDVVNLVFLESVVDRNNDTARRQDAVNGLKKGRRTGGEDADARQTSLEEVVSQAAGPVGHFPVRATDEDAIGC